MLLKIKDLEVKDLPFDQVWNSGEIDFSGSGFTQRGELKATGLASLLPHTGGEIRIKGSVSVELESPCDRCLGSASFPINSPFDLFYKPAESASEAEETAIDEGEAEIGYYELPGLELEQVLAEYVLLQLPMQRVCQPDCKGICPICGGNRNETPCTCETHPPDDRWSSLKSLKQDKNR